MSIKQTIIDLHTVAKRGKALMNALILFDSKFTSKQMLSEMAAKFMDARARVRFVSLDNVDVHSFDEITHLVVAYPPQRFCKDVQCAFDEHRRAGMHMLPISEVPRMLWFYTQGAPQRTH